MFGYRTPKRGTSLFCTIVLAGVGFQAAAATINVNSTADAVNGNDGLCTLREAVIAANTDTASGVVVGECPKGNGADTINLLAETYNLTRGGANEDNALTGDLDILGPVTISGAGQLVTLIYGNDLDRILEIHDSFAGAVLVRDLILSHGETNGNGGAAMNRGDLTLRRVTSTKHSADDGATIYSTDELELVDCIIDGALAADDGGGLFLAPGSTTKVTRTVFTENEAGGTGGGIDNAGSLELIQSQVGGDYRSDSARNTAINGAGIYNRSAGTLTMKQSTIGRNTANNFGGGLVNEGTVTMTNSTVSGNQAVNSGGNIENRSTGTITFLNSTVSYGVAPNGSAIRNQGSASTTNSIFQGECSSNDLVSNGGNLESPGNLCGLNLGSDKRNVAPGQLLLELLSDNGGPTDTNRLRLPSVAIDTGLLGPCPSQDQRGVPRPLDGDSSGDSDCDIGAFEAEPLLFADGFETGDTSRWTVTSPPIP